MSERERATMSSDKPKRCKVGIHSWFSDASLIARADVCSRCGQPRDEREHDALVAERRRIMAVPAGANIGDLYRAALGMPARPDLHVHLQAKVQASPAAIQKLTAEMSRIQSAQTHWSTGTSSGS